MGACPLTISRAWTSKHALPYFILVPLKALKPCCTDAGGGKNQAINEIDYTANICSFALRKRNLRRNVEVKFDLDQLLILIK